MQAGTGYCTQQAFKICWIRSSMGDIATQQLPGMCTSNKNPWWKCIRWFMCLSKKCVNIQLKWFSFRILGRSQWSSFTLMDLTDQICSFSSFVLAVNKTTVVCTALNTFLSLFFQLKWNWLLASVKGGEWNGIVCASLKTSLSVHNFYAKLYLPVPSGSTPILSIV